MSLRTSNERNATISRDYQHPISVMQSLNLDSRLNFWSTYVGVGLYPTSDTMFYLWVTVFATVRITEAFGLP